MSRFFCSLLLFCSVSAFTGCQQYTETFQVIREETIQFEIEEREERWQARNFAVEEVGQVVYYEDENDREGEFFYRIIIAGFEDNPNTIERFELTLDVKDLDDLRGVYKTVYSEIGGINTIKWIETEEGSGFFPTYQLPAVPDTTETEFIIKRQKLDETLIAGTFKATLVERTDASDVIRLTNGIFDDLNYKED